MRILFAIQGTGNGHITRARDIYPELIKYGDVDVLVSGTQADVPLPYPVKYKLYGLSFIFGKGGGVDIWKSVKRSNLPRLYTDIKKLDIRQYDLVVNDFEPVSAWACRMARKPCISLSHQCAVLHPDAPKPKATDWLGKTVLERYAPTTDAYGFHFKSYGDKIYTPVIRREIRALTPTDEGHYTVYLPSYDDATILTHLKQFPQASWQVFSKHNKQALVDGNVSIRPIESEGFIRSMAASTGVLCGAGFEGPAEALHLGKKLMVIPMQTQYEQQCNAAAAQELGVPAIGFLGKKYYDEIGKWLSDPTRVSVNYPDLTTEIVARLVRDHAPKA